MDKHVRTLIGEGAPPAWVSFRSKHIAVSTVDTSQRSMDVATILQSTEEDSRFVLQRRAAINALLTDRFSKIQRFSTQDVMRGRNVAKGFAQASERMPIERPNTATVSSSTSNKPDNLAATAAMIKANMRLPEWAKNQIADEPIEDEKRRPELDRKQLSRRNFDNDDDDRPKRGGGFGRNRRGRGRGDDDDDGEETRPSKDVTLFDFFEAKSKSTTQKAATASSTTSSKTTNQSQKIDSKNIPYISSAVQKQIFEFENGDQVLARYYQDNEYYPAIVMSVMHNTQKCSVMFEGYDTQEIVNFDGIEPFEEGYYNNEEEEYEQEQLPPPSQRTNATSQYQQPLSQQKNQPVHPKDQSGYGYYNQQQQQQRRDNQNRPNSGRGNPQQQYPNRYNNSCYY